MEAAVVDASGRTLTDADHVCLSRLLIEQRGQCPEEQAVQDVLLHSVRLPPSVVPPSLITMDTRVLLKNRGSDEPYAVTLCFPEQADAARAHVSVLSPLGAGLLGLSVGDTVSWRAFGSEHVARILGILSPGEYVWGRR